MAFQCKTCNLDFTTSSNLRKHERTEKHLTKCQLITTIETTSSDQKIKELEEKLEKAEQTILLQKQLIQAYQVIVQLTGLPDPMLPEIKLSEIKIPEVVPELKAPKKVKKSKPVPELVVESVVEPIVEPVVEPVVEPEPIPEPVPEPVPEPKPVKKLKKAKLTEEEQIEENQTRIEFLRQLWDEYETRLSFKEIQQEIESYQPRNEVEQKFKDSYYSRFMNDYMDRRPKVVTELNLEIKPEPEKRRKLKIVIDPPKDLEAEVFKPEPEKRRKLKIIQDPPAKQELRQINNNIMDYESVLAKFGEHSKEARDAKFKFNMG